MLDGLVKFTNALIDTLPKLYTLYKNEKHEEKIVELLECFLFLEI